MHSIREVTSELETIAGFRVADSVKQIIFRAAGEASSSETAAAGPKFEASRNSKRNSPPNNPRIVPGKPPRKDQTRASTLEHVATGFKTWLPSVVSEIQPLRAQSANSA
jgi:hypothetical protein